MAELVEHLMLMGQPLLRIGCLLDLWRLRHLVSRADNDIPGLGSGWQKPTALFDLAGSFSVPERCRAIAQADTNLSPQLKPRLFRSTAENFAINDINCHFCTSFADADRVTLIGGVHLCE